MTWARDPPWLGEMIGLYVGLVVLWDVVGHHAVLGDRRENVYIFGATEKPNFSRRQSEGSYRILEIISVVRRTFQF